MGVVKQIDTKNEIYYFYNNIIDLKNLDARLFKVEKKSYKNIGIYNIGYIIIKTIDDCENIYGVNPLYLRIDHANGYIEEKGVINIWFLILQMKIKSYSKELYNDVWNGIKNKIKEINSGECDYEKDFMKIKFDSDDNLPLKKPLKFHNMTITIRSVF